VTAAPTFFLAYTALTDSKVKTEVRLPGAVPFASFKTQIDKLLAAGPKVEEAPKKP